VAAETDSRAVLLVCGTEAQTAPVRHELEARYGCDYVVRTVATTAEAGAALDAAAASGADVALVLAAAAGGDDAPAELLSRVPALYPAARRGLLVPWLAWADRGLASTILRAMARGWIDYYVLEPVQSPDELFHRTVSEFLHEWARLRGLGPSGVSIVGDARARRSYELRSMLSQNGIPHAFVDRAGAAPLVEVRGGPTLVDPADADVASAFGLPTRLTRTDFDVAIVGGGPAGLTAAVYAASEGLQTLVVEGRAIGGQAASSSRIRNYPGFARGIAGADLAMRTYQQAWVLGSHFVLMQRVERIDERDGRLALDLADGAEARATAVVVATGASYRRLGIPSLEALIGTGVYYGASLSEAQTLAGEDVYVVGGGNSAGQAALHVARYARRVTLVVRRPSLAQTMSRYLIDELDATPNVAVRLRTTVVDGGGAGRLERLVLCDADTGGTSEVAAAALLVLIGAEPHTAWLDPRIARDEAGYLLVGADVERHGGWQLDRAPMPLETSQPGLFAAGDVRRRAVKRVASAVGDGASVIAQVHDYLELCRL
jgi:thioredoxin reductase (NADPH)